MDERRHIFTDCGRNHSAIKWQWIMVGCYFLNFGLAAYNTFHSFRIRTQFYWLWSSPPSILWPLAFTAIWLILAVLMVFATRATVKGIRKHELHIYDDGIEGYGFKRWDFWPKLRRFEFEYSDITRVKKSWPNTLTIYAMTGKYMVYVSESEICEEKIMKQFWQSRD